MNRILVLTLAIVLLAAAILLVTLNSRQSLDRGTISAPIPPAAVAMAAPEPPAAPLSGPAASTPAPVWSAVAPATSSPSPTPSVSAAPGSSVPSAGLVELAMKLPRWQFGGTTPNLDPKRYDPPRVLSPLLVPRDVRLLSLKAPVTASDREPIIGALEMVTDGDKEGLDGSFMELAPGPQWVQIDLGTPRQIYVVALWHYHAQARVYHDVVVQCADDPDFVTGVRTLYNNDADNSAGLGAGRNREYIEDYKGKLFDFSREAAGRPPRTRYLRLTSNGNTNNEMNHYIEIEVYGR